MAILSTAKIVGMLASAKKTGSQVMNVAGEWVAVVMLQPVEYSYINNTSQWLDSIVTVDGMFYVRVETIANGTTVVAPLNIVEITRTSS